MKRQDLMDYEVVLALYTICHCADGMIDEIEESDLPEESLREGYRAVRSSVCALTESLEQYRNEKIDVFNSSCDE